MTKNTKKIIEESLELIRESVRLAEEFLRDIRAGRGEHVIKSTITDHTCMKDVPGQGYNFAGFPFDDDCVVVGIRKTASQIREMVGDQRIRVLQDRREAVQQFLDSYRETLADLEQRFKDIA